MRVRHTAEVLGTFFGIVFFVLAGLITGTGILAVTVNLLSLSLQVVLSNSVATVLGFSFFVLVGGAVHATRVWDFEEPDRHVSAGPTVHAIVPAYKDAEVLDISVESIAESEYEPIRVSVVVEDDDPETRERADELAEKHDEVDCLVNGNSGSKAGAINYVVEESDADFFAVFDADESVSPKFIPVAVGELLGGKDVFQGRRVPRPTGAVETLAYCERVVVEAGYAFSELFGFTNCQSASTVFTREAFEAAGGYEDRLTEDIEFAHSCHRADLSVRHDRSYTNTMEAPHTLRDLWGQRKRWRIGQTQVFRARLSEAAKGDVGIGSIASVGRASGAVAVGLFLLVLSAHAFLLALGGFGSLLLIPAACAVLTVVGVWGKDFTKSRVGSLHPVFVFAPLAYLGHGVLTMKAVLEYHLTWEGEWYEVEKKGA
jgi:hypothetical protein